MREGRMGKGYNYARMKVIYELKQTSNGVQMTCIHLYVYLHSPLTHREQLAYTENLHETHIHTVYQLDNTSYLTAHTQLVHTLPYYHTNL